MPVAGKGHLKQNLSSLSRARIQAKLCGVSRLANITGLDRIGLPVWQAIRPLGRALSVHQGKGRTDQDALLGAIGEAIESHSAETVEPDIDGISYASLKRQEPVIPLDQLRSDDAAVPDETAKQQWIEMRNISNNGSFYVPHASVSLDYTRAADPALDRSSNGLGAGTNWNSAFTKALFECIERDAAGLWMRRAPIHRLACEIDPASLPDDWHAPWKERLEIMSANTRIFRLPSITGASCFLCSMVPNHSTTPESLPTYGSACAADPEQALFSAFAEAVQSRLTLIAGARDDMMPDSYPSPHKAYSTFPFCPPIPPGWTARKWTLGKDHSAGWSEQVRRLGDTGFDKVLVKRLTPDTAPIKVAKVIVPGLGTLTRRRAAAA